jgi:hypothetical protein
MPLAACNQPSILGRMPDRRNHFAREGLRRVVRGHFAHGELVITAAGAAQRFQLPLPICERLLEELVSAGALVRSAAGAYSASERLAPPLTRPEDHAVTAPKEEPRFRSS